MVKKQSDKNRREALERLPRELETAWLEGSDADFSNLVDLGVTDPHRFAWTLAGRLADERNRLLRSVQRALLGASSPLLYGVCAAVRASTITLTFYVGAGATEEELEDLRAVGTEVIADFTDNFRIEEAVHLVRKTDEPLRTAGDWVYLQRGFRTVEQ